MHGWIVFGGFLYNNWVFCADGNKYVLPEFDFPIRKHFLHE